MTYRTIKEQIRKLGYLTEKDFALEYGDMLAEDVNDVCLSWRRRSRLLRGVW